MILEISENLHIHLMMVVYLMTNSLNAFGGISSIDIVKGANYNEIVGVSTIVGITTGTGTILEPSSNTIGKILSTKIENIGLIIQQIIQFVLQPILKFFTESLTSFDK